MRIKQFFIFLFCLAANAAVAQFHEDFVGCNLDTDTNWVGTTDKFTIYAVDAAHQMLQLNDVAPASSANRAYLSRKSQALVNAEWQISLVCKAALSSGNYARFYVATDTAELTASQKGYFVWIGNTGKEISLYRQDGTKNTKIIAGTEGRANLNDTINIKVTRDSLGNWELLSRMGSEREYTSEGTCHDQTHLAAAYTGVLFYYSKTNNTNYYCDQISAEGEPYIPPQKPLQLIDRHAIVFSEIMADPDPQVQLPNHEWLEIYNRTDSVIDLGGWHLTVNNKTAVIDEGEIAAHSYAVICPAAAQSVFAKYGNAIAPHSWNALTNSSATITLSDREMQTITWVEYSDSWYGKNGFKKDGGWSLERLSAEYLDNHAENWQPSNDARGGTPCQRNSTAVDIMDYRTPVVAAVAVATPDTLKITFSKSMDERTLAQRNNYRFELAIDTILIAQPQTNVIKIALHEPMAADAVYTLTLANLLCIDQNEIDETELEVAIPVAAEVGDLVINEILFNPKDDGVDFVEVLNLSDKALDVSQLFITRYKAGELEARTTICSDPQLLLAHRYVVFTSDPEMVCYQYDCGSDAQFFTVRLPSLNNDEGNIVFARADGTILDAFAYTDKMHHPFVSDPKGVSLERVNPYAPTQQADNWQSAAFNVGYATPGQRNSQYLVPTAETESQKNFWLEYETFTPDNDGFRDLLLINYQLPQEGFTASANIYTPTGQRVRHLLNGELLATENTLVWNGYNDSDQLCQPGIYVIHIEAVQPSGITIEQKIVCVLSMR